MKDAKSKTKRFLALLLAVVMVFCSVPNVTTYFANTENSGGEGGEGGSELAEEEKNNAAVSIKLTDSYSGDAITGDIAVKYAVLKDGETVNENTEWTTVNGALDEVGVITVLEEKTVSISDTKLYVQIEKENYIAYQSTAENAIELSEYDENLIPSSVEIELDMELLTGINQDYDGNAIPVAEINLAWESLLNVDGIMVSYALKCDGEDVELEDISTMPEVKDTGTYELTITVSKQDGSEAEWTQTITSMIIKASIENVSITAPTSDLIYDGTEKELVELDDTGLKTDDTITWYVKSANEDDGQYEEVGSYSYEEGKSIELPKKTDAGKYTIKVVVQRENHNDYTQVVENIQIYPGEIDLEGIKITGYGGTYDGQDHDAVTVESQSGYTYTLQYQLHECTSENCDHLTVDEEAWKDECPEVKDAGSYIVWVKAVVEDTNYEDTDVPVIGAEKAEVPFNVYIEKYTPEISFTEDEFNKETSSSKVTKTDLDNGVEYVFGAAYVGDVQPSENITYSVLKQDTDGEFVEDETATIDDAGKLIIEEEGVYEITASFAGNGSFNASDITHTLYVGVEAGTETADKLIAFIENQKEYIFNMDNAQISDFTAEKTYATDNGAVTYSIDKTLDGAIAIDVATGKVTVKDYEKLMSKINTAKDKTVTLTVIATKVAVNYNGTDNVQYGADSDSYEITLKFIETPANPYKITGTLNEENNWYSTEVTLTAPDDYTISKSLENFAESVTYDEQGVLENSYVYLMDNEGNITAPIPVQKGDGTNLKIDTVAPSTVMVEYSKPLSLLEKVLDEALENLLGKVIYRFYQSSVELTFTSTDETSGVEYFEWKYIPETDASISTVASDEDWNKVAAEWDEDTKQYTATITLSASEAAQYRGHILVHAVDKAGKQSAETDDTGNVFVVDSISPEVTISYSTDDKLDSSNVYDGKIIVQIEVKEMNFYEEDIQVSVTKDGTEIQVPKIKWNADTKNTDTYIGTFTITGDGNYIVSVNYSDKSGNAAIFEDGKISYTSEEMLIDTTDPIVDITYNKESVEGEEDKQTVTFTITERNFNPKNIKVDGSITIANGENSLDIKGIETLLQNETWEEMGDDTYSYTYDFANGDSYFEGTYELTVKCTDIVGRSGTATSAFTIDHTKPTMTVDYSKPAQTVDGVAYYKDVTAENPVQVTINVVEENFEAEDMVIAVTKDGTEYTLNDNEIIWTIDADNGAKHTGVISLTKEGHYTITVNYKDHWNNVMDECTTQTLVIDNTAPEIYVEYTNSEVKNTFTDINGEMREYFADPQVAEIKITERNFRSEDVTYMIKVYDDITGDEITASNLYTVTECVPGDEQYTHTFTITYPGDANYSFDISCKDLATNEKKRETDYFTVDATASDVNSITIEYEEPDFIEIVIEGVKKFFGFTNEKVVVTFTASDTTSGIKEFVWQYEKDADASNTNHATTEWETATAELVTNPDGTKVYSAEIELPSDVKSDVDIEYMRGNLRVKAVNKSGKESSVKDDADRIFVIDKIGPGVEAKHTAADTGINYNQVGDVHYYSGDVAFTFIMTEVNFYPEDVNVFVSKDNAEKVKLDNSEITWVQDSENEDVYSGTFELSGDGDYVVTVEYSDRSNNEMESIYKPEVITIDTIAPELDFAFDKQTQTLTFTVKEHNFDATEIMLSGTREDVNGEPVAEEDFVATELTALLQSSEWKPVENEEDTYQCSIAYTDAAVQKLDGIYDLSINYIDKAINKAVTNEPEVFILDRTAPSKVEITYSKSIPETILEFVTLGFYNPDITVTFTAYDAYAGVESFNWIYTKVDGTSNTNRPTDGTENVLAAVQDKDDLSKYTATKTLSDTDIKQMHGYITAYAVDTYQNDNETEKTEDSNKIFVVDTISPKMKVNYPNPDEENEDGSITYYRNDKGEVEITFTVKEANFYEENVKVSVSKDGDVAQPVTVTWTSSSYDDHTGTYTLTGDGDYVVYVEYSDYSGNVMVDEEDVKVEKYQSHIITIDTKKPEVKMEFDKGTQTTTFIIEEHNFDPAGITITGDRKDLNGKVLDFAEVKLQEILQNAEWTQDVDTYTYIYDYKKDGESFDGIYNLTINYTDLSGRVAETCQPKEFTIDRMIPADVEITYSDPLEETFIERIIENIMETITLGFYNPDVTVTLTTYDAHIGVDYFEWKHTKQDGASADNRSTDAEFTKIEAVQDTEDKTKYTATFKLPESEAEQIRGWLAAKATDNYGNVSNLVNDEKKILVVDTVSPTIQVEYTPADRVVGTTSYYNNDVDIKFTVDEANFFAEDVVVKVSKDGGEAVALTTNWTSQSTDIHIGTAQLSGDGDYVITVEYKDRSNNEMVKYTSNVHTIDTITPVIKVEYQNTDVVNILEDRDEHSRNYFAGTQTAVITITEHNFNADDVVWMLTATDVTGKELDINSLHVKGAWEDGTQADTHTFTIIYPGDANYTFDMAYTDLATNQATDYAPDYFTVDNTAPINLKVDYSTSLLETILETITFGFYNATVEVTLTAEDITSGVHGFVYNYTNASGVSDVNAELLEQAIEAAEITYSNEGQIAVVKFNIPKAVLGNTNQFNGTISFETTDRSGIKSVFADEKRIVVDNIAPTAQVTYNQPVNTEGSISYYAGDITATVVINEANFYAEDVSVMVSKDGGAATAVTPSWVDNSVDVHTGTFTLTEDGDYFITINYKDKSTNQMAQYASDQLTIDTDIEAPVIKFNGKNENGQPYKGEVVPSISFGDINYDSYEVHLYRTYKGAINVDITEEKGLKGMFSVGEQDGTASFDIFVADENGKYKAEDDGIYHLTITMFDKAGHEINSEAYFTVNRYGSVYEYGEYLVSLISNGGAFKQEITEELTITEYNADRLVGNSLNIEITRDGKPLDTVEYTVSPEINEHVAVGESGWFQYQYTISKNNFVQDGIYKISVSSKDATGNAPENSNFEDKNILFYVDSTVPEITSITGLEESIVDNTELSIRYMIFDAMALKSVTVYVDGEVLDEITDFSSDLNNYEGEFTLQESEEQRSIRIVAEDKAGNITDTASEDFTSAYVFNDKVIVTTNAFVRFFANKPLFYGSIAGVIGIVGFIGFGISLRNKKKQK